VVLLYMEASKVYALNNLDHLKQFPLFQITDICTA